MAPLATAQAAIIAISGADAYISPDGYGAPDQVPIWNYVAFHLHGTLSLASPADLHPMLNRLSAAFGSRLTPKPEWTAAKMASGVMERRMRAILPCRIAVNAIHGTWKLNQIKAPEHRQRAADKLKANGIGGSPCWRRSCTGSIGRNPLSCRRLDRRYRCFHRAHFI